MSRFLAPLRDAKVTYGPRPNWAPPRSKLVHLAVYRPGCPPPAKALCGARVSEAASADGPDCVVCASLLAGMESGKGE
jgi:hypothetical protein